MKTQDLIGAQLDWAVAKCEGHSNLRVGVFSGDLIMDPPRVEYGAISLSSLDYSTDWAQGGPILERELLAPEPMLDTNCSLIQWRCQNWKGDGADYYGPTPLIAAMRVYVMAKFGREIEVPEELK